MPTSLGISVGASGVGAALLVDTATGLTSEYRRLAVDSGRHRDVGDLVFDAISLMTTQVVDQPVPDAVTVAYRTEEQADAIRTAAERRGKLVRLVPETTALLAYLRTVGVRSEPGSVAIADMARPAPPSRSSIRIRHRTAICTYRGRQRQCGRHRDLRPRPPRHQPHANAYAG